MLIRLNCWNQIQHSIATVPHTTQLLTSLSMSHTSQDCQVECLWRELALHFTVCLVRTSSAEVNSTGMWWCILPKKTCDLESLVENVGLHSVIIPKMFFRARFSCHWHTHCVSHSLHLIAHIWQHSDIRPHKHNQDSFLFTVDFNFLSGNSLDANNKNGNCHVFMSQWISCRLSCNPATHCNRGCVYVTESRCTPTKTRISCSKATSTSHHTHYSYKHLHWWKRNLYDMVVANDHWYI
jgi:hypothetical protein